MSEGERVLPVVLALLHGDREPSIELRETGEAGNKRRYFALRDAPGNEEIGIWLDALPLPDKVIARTLINTTSQNYIVQLSDQLPSPAVGRVLAYEVSELLTARQRAAEGLAPVHENLLRLGAELPQTPDLSGEDRGRIGELNWLAAEMGGSSLDAQSREQSRVEFSALLERLGMRPTLPSESEAFADEADAAGIRRHVAGLHLTAEANRAVYELAFPIEDLSPDDAAALLAHRQAAALTTTHIPAHIGHHTDLPMPGYDADGVPLLREDLDRAATAAAERRTQLSAATVRELAAEQQWQPGRPPRRKVIIGGGASLSGRDPDALLIDARGRWHVDPGMGIVQSADQVRDLYGTGVGDAHQFAGPTDRVPAKAVQLWEDELAVRGRVVDGHAQLVVGRNGKLLARVQPSAGEDPFSVEVIGTPTIATGLTPEMVPGAARGAENSLRAAVRKLETHVAGLEGDGSMDAAAGQSVRTGLTEAVRGGAGAREILRLLDEAGIKDTLGAEKENKPVFQTLEATRLWEEAREQAPGRALMGDEVADGRFDPTAAQHWMIAGAGGTGVANAEIILQSNPDAQVTIVGREPPPALRHQVQFDAMRQRHETAFGGDGRLSFVRAELEAVQTVVGPDGRTRFQVQGADGEIESDGYVANLGRTSPLPQVTEQLDSWTRGKAGEVSGDLLFDESDQFLGYGLTFEAEGRDHRVEVTGAASWQLPTDAFDPATTRALLAMGGRQIPAESGNAAPGFEPTARQSAALARAREEGPVHRLNSVPERWQRPGTGLGTATGMDEPKSAEAAAAPAVATPGAVPTGTVPTGAAPAGTVPTEVATPKATLPEAAAAPAPANAPAPTAIPAPPPRVPKPPTPRRGPGSAAESVAAPPPAPPQPPGPGPGFGV
ncbi:hypothetical protein [Streptomyces sp. H27-D2]|uniref:hypothetical protein n=1 Tax=Streptomyces sp. H27-D2 TaxID=3046304 RepID=UPI002DB60F42|nr:hypothetical protein [Streptomyces sp. H27-D2]MEC4018013.1 hypothetical protein [Streptomyces sp. H27-D2]